MTLLFFCAGSVIEDIERQPHDVKCRLTGRAQVLGWCGEYGQEGSK